MKILTFTSLFPNGVQRELGVFIYQRTVHLAQLPSNEVEVVAPVPYFPSWMRVRPWDAYGQVPRDEITGGLRSSHPRYPLLPGIFMPLHGWLMFLGCLNHVRKLHRQSGFDCIDAHYVYPDGFAAVLLGDALGIPTFVSARGTDINVFPEFWIIRPMIRWTLRRAAGLIAVSEAMSKRILALEAVEGKIRVIPNGVDLRRFHPTDRNEARKRLGISEEGQILVSVGSLKAVKRHELLIRAVRRVSERYPKLRLYIVGKGPLHSQLEVQVEEMGLAGRVFLVGDRPHDELCLWFNAADVSCLASASEGCPNVLMESMACGTPVVATKVGGIPEIVRLPELGRLVNGDPESLAGGIVTALGQNWDRNLLAEHAQQRDWVLVAKEADEFMRSRLESNEPRPQ
jgi:teichuronic acid biosynthesis glycosyltransferase TuaC